MTEYMQGTFDSAINLIDLLNRNTSLALADEPRPIAGRIAIIDMARTLIARKHDIHMLEVEVLAIDIMPVAGDESFAWEVEMHWMVYCSECDAMSLMDTGEFTPPLCRRHLNEAIEQEWADRENDDRAIGLS